VHNNNNNNNNNETLDHIILAETIDHILSACPILAKEQYMKRHDCVLCTTILQHMQGNRGTVGQKTLV